MSRPGFKRVEPFSPTQIAGCQLWLDAADVNGNGTTPANGSTVTTWIDKSGNSRNGSSTGSPTITSGQIIFSGSQLFSGSLSNTTTNLTAFVVAKITINPATYASRILSASAGGLDYDNTASMDVLVYDDTGNLLTSFRNYTRLSSVVTTSNQTFIAVTRTNATTNTLYLNGTGSTTVTLSGGAVGSFGYTTYWVGSGPSGAAITGTVSEVLYYHADLTDTQRQQVEGYLAQKWGLKNALPGGHLGQTGIIYPTVRRNGTLNTASSTLPYYTQFSPLSISGCKIWLDATDSSTFTLNGSTVSAWNDKTGNGYNVIQATTSNQPTRGTNEVIFNGTNHILQYTGSIGISGNPYTAYVIYKATVIDVYLRGAVTCMDSTSGFSFEIGQFDRWTPSSASTYLQFSSSSNITLMGINSEPAGSVRQSLNGQAFSAGGAGWSAPASGSALAVGYSLAKAWYFGGSIYEFLLFSRTLTDTEHNQITGYLASKWGSQTYLPSNHPNKTVSVGTLPLVTNLIGVPRRNMIPKTIPVAVTFNYTGADQSFVVPASKTSITVYMWAAGGQGTTTINGSFYGGAGAYVQGVLTVTPGETLTIYVGQRGNAGPTFAYKNGGYNSADDQGTGTAGGRSGIARSSTNIVAVGAGGGGGGNGNGGAGGITSGSSGTGTNPGGGGTQSAGGTAASSGYNSGGVGQNFGGGTGPGAYGGSGGDGFYGGGGGAAFGSGQLGGGGGGGSSLTSNLTSLVTFVSSNGYSAPNTSSPYYTSNVAAGGLGLSGTAGNGLVVIVY